MSMTNDIRHYINLCELTPSHAKHIVKSDDWQYKKLLNWLQENGYECLDGGESVYSRVYAKPGSNIVIKFNEDTDEAYEWFMQYCKQNKGNPCLPKIGTIKEYKDTSNGFIVKPLFVVFIERLKPIETLSMGFAVWMYLNLNVYNRIVYMKSSQPGWPSESKMYANMWYKANTQLCDTLLDIKQKKPHNFEFDLHKDNFMLRGNQKVIIDPLAPQ